MNRLAYITSCVAFVISMLAGSWWNAAIAAGLAWMFWPPNTREHGWAAYGIKEVLARRWWPPYLIGRYRWRWQAIFMCWYHFYGTQFCGETWIEFHPKQYSGKLL